MSIPDDASDNASKAGVKAAKHGYEFPPKIGTLCGNYHRVKHVLNLTDAVP